MKKIIISIFALCLCVIGFAFADTINLHWLNEDGTTYQNSTCVIDNDLIIPTTPPTKYGHTFTGWKRFNYIPLEYIESTGTQWIDTGIIPSTNMQSEIRGKFLSVDNTMMHILSARSGENGYNTMYAWNSYSDTGHNFAQFSSGSYAIIRGAKDTDIHTIISVIKPSYTTITMDNLASTKENTNVAYDIPLTINGRNIGGYVTDIATYRYYYVKIWKDDTLVRDFVPVVDSGGVVCMYDRVTGQFFYNSGTGDFIAGPVLQ